jgi:hypothetical protein
MTTALVVWQRQVLTALGVGLGAGVAAVAALLLISWFQRKRVIALAKTKVSDTDLSRAASEVAKDKSELLRKVVNSAIADVAADQNLPKDLVRGALFARSPGGSLRIPDGLAVNFRSHDEEVIAIRPGESGVGEAVSSGRPVITVFVSPGEDTTIQDETERARIDPDLRWIISLPIASPGEYAPWVLAIDGLTTARTQEQLRSSVGRLLYYVELLELLLR